MPLTPSSPRPSAGWAFGDRFDVRIAAAVHAGRTQRQIAASLNLGLDFVRVRGHALGLTAQIQANGCAARARSAGLAYRHRAARTAYIEALAALPADHLISSVVRRLRDHPVDLSDAAIAALHKRGLTLDELSDGTSRRPHEIVLAIRVDARCA